MQVVHSKFQDLVPKRIELDDPELQRPDEDRIKEVSIKCILILILILIIQYYCSCSCAVRCLTEGMLNLHS